MQPQLAALGAGENGASEVAVVVGDGDALRGERGDAAAKRVQDKWDLRSVIGGRPWRAGTDIHVLPWTGEMRQWVAECSMETPPPYVRNILTTYRGCNIYDLPDDLRRQWEAWNILTTTTGPTNGGDRNAIEVAARAATGSPYHLPAAIYAVHKRLGGEAPSSLREIAALARPDDQYERCLAIVAQTVPIPDRATLARLWE